MRNALTSLFLVMVLFFYSFQINTFVAASTGNELRNAEAFSGKNNYHSNAKYNISTYYPRHEAAYLNAINQMNAVSGANIRLARGSTPNINMRSINSSNYSWYGHASWNSNSALLRLNNYTTTRANYTASNYNKTAMHELGHAFYMKHQHSSVGSVMKSGKYPYNSYSSLDKSNLAYRY
ncbi:hypothetical protein JNUCC1_01516 [Lentibacillus sp. JNUCC-1]|uniref:Xaa-Pro aminopeptidase n=1 Tax=Lentibacillus sp. JNUCC-1 TaxID=2654513 RepID=UPI0012E7C10F|nr:Xaa-Pro aminopeptidase [Lentibacillus sp. JNUCC-1]MUV37710.1 hypothetical protein [Lentibacillus sp. JNUCC-1]